MNFICHNALQQWKFFHPVHSCYVLVTQFYIFFLNLD